MKRFHCRCGMPIYFDNHRCGRCGRALAFDPATLSMVAEQTPGAGLPFCSYRSSDSACNWLTDDAHGACVSCRTSRVIPALSKPENRERWRVLERAKRRLLYDLLRLGLTVDASRLRFEFKEDRRTNPDVVDDHVTTGHNNGVITINAAEADDVYREQMRANLDEPYRTVLGNFRHESGHYYFRELVTDACIAEARSLFGDERVDYAAALRRYYTNGPAANWQQHFITGYASAHPAEDWAECWAHYLHVQAVLEAAYSNGLIADDVRGSASWQYDFIELALSLNAVQRSLGLPDAYPFVITAPVADKLAFVHSLLEPFSRPPASSAAPSD